MSDIIYSGELILYESGEIQMEDCTANREVNKAWPPPPVWNSFELEVMDAAVRQLTRRKVYVEIGSFRGGTAWHFAPMLEPGATIICIDLPGGFGGFRWTESDLCRTVLELRDRGFDAHAVLGDSNGPATQEEVQAILPGRTIDVLLIDGDHRTGAALDDWRNYSRLLNGVCLWHDIGRENGRLPYTLERAAFMQHTRTGFEAASFGHRYITAQADFGSGAIFHP